MKINKQISTITPRNSSNESISVCLVYTWTDIASCLHKMTLLMPTAAIRRRNVFNLALA